MNKKVLFPMLVVISFVKLHRSTTMKELVYMTHSLQGYKSLVLWKHSLYCHF